MLRLTSFLVVLVVLVGVGKGWAGTVLPSVPGFDVEVYAEVTDPTTMTLDTTGNMFVGRDNTGSGGQNQDPVHIHSIGVGGTPVTEYGNTVIPDPDAVLFDAAGTISGTAGSVLVGGRPVSNERGRIWAVRPDETIVELLDLGHGTNPNGMVFDSTGRLLFADSNLPGRIWATTGGTATPLYTFAISTRARSIAVDASDRVFVTKSDGTISVHDSSGGLLDGGFATGLSDPTYIAFGWGEVFGSELYGMSGGELLRFDDLGNSTVIGNGFDVGQISFGPDGTLYVSDFNSDRILRITPIPEPSTLILLTMGAVGLLAYGWRRRK